MGISLSVILLVQIGGLGITQTATAQSDVTIPDWIKDLSNYWANEKISDKEYATAIEYLIQSKVITSDRITIINEIESNAQNTSDEINIPDWIRNNAKWFADGILDDSEFIKGIEFMIEEKVIQSPRIKILDDVEVVFDTDNDGLLDDVDNCPNQAETINGFEDSDGCPDEVPLADKSLKISNIDVSWQNSGWGDQHINLSWTYDVEHVDENNIGFPEDGHFVIEITGIDTIIEKAQYVGDSKFSGQFNGIDPGIGGGTITLTIISFIEDDRGNYVGDGDQKQIIIPANT